MDPTRNTELGKLDLGCTWEVNKEFSTSSKNNPQVLIPESFSFPIAPIYDASVDALEVDCRPLVDFFKVCSISNEIDIQSIEPIADLSLEPIHIEQSVEVPACKKTRKRSAAPRASTWTHTKLRRSGRAKSSRVPSNTFDTAIPLDDSDMDSPISNRKLISPRNKGKKLPITLNEGVGLASYTVTGKNVVQVDSPSIQPSQTSSRCLRKRKHVEVKEVCKAVKKTLKQIKAAEKKKDPPKPRKPRWFGLRTRSCPLQFFRCIQTLRPNKKEAVRNMGFGQLLTFMVDCIPLRLSYYVVDHFSPDLMVIKVGTKEVKVDSLSITKLLGVPSGNITFGDDNILPTTDEHVAQWRNDQDVNNRPEVNDKDNSNFYHMEKSFDDNQEDACDPSNDHEICQLGDKLHVHFDKGNCSDGNNHGHEADNSISFVIKDLNDAFEKESVDKALQTTVNETVISDNAVNIVEQPSKQGNFTKCYYTTFVLDPDECPKWSLGMTQVFEQPSSHIDPDFATPANKAFVPSYKTASIEGTPTELYDTPNSPHCETPIQVPFSEEDTNILYSSPNHPLRAIPVSAVPSADKIQETLNK
ncbi:hypothetical protein SSX86_010102 [Deinandra increscens subsp. villosa]|uniref:Uncharacterized protein n=1 Tax=Deinandra increscens subsp. villosa TaxID=3103831 RepID=A0AAP0H1N4_9ASTR